MSSSPRPGSAREPATDPEEPTSNVTRSAAQFVADNTGLLLIVSAQALFSMMNATVKQLSTMDPPVSASELILVRMLITFICSLVYMLATRMHDPIFGPKGVRLLLVFRGIFGFLGLLGGYFSIQYLSLPDATVLLFLSPLCTALAGAVFLKERFRLYQGLAGVVSLVGVIFIARPPFLFGAGEDAAPDASVPPTVMMVGKKDMTERVIAVGAALVGALGLTGGYICMRAIGRRAHPMHVLVSYASYSVIIAVCWMIATRTPLTIPTSPIWFALLLMMGIFGFVGQILLTMGVQREPAWRASMAVYTQIVFATLFEFMYFHTLPSSLSILGTVLILSSALYVAATKEEVKTQQPERGPIGLDDGDCDHLERALHAPPAKDDPGIRDYGRAT